MLLGAVGPVALAAAASGLGTRTLSLRYLLFAHLFLLAAAGLLVWRIPSRPARLAVAGLVLAASGGGAVDFLRGLRLADHPGARGAAEFVAAARGPDEWAVAAGPYWYFPLDYHLGDDRVRVYDPGVPMPHYQGTAALRPVDRIDAGGLERAGGRRLWVVGGRGGSWGRVEIPPPAGWVLREEREFPEALRVGVAVVRVYERPDGPATCRPSGSDGAARSAGRGG